MIRTPALLSYTFFLLLIGTNDGFSIISHHFSNIRTTTRAQQRPTIFRSASSINSNDDEEEAQRLIALTKDFMADGNGFYSKAKPEWFADDFAFQGEILGPMNKEGYIRNLEGFQLYEAFPDIQPNPSSFVMDSQNPRRVWLQVRVTGTHKQSIPLRILPWAPPLKFEATGAVVKGGPEAFSVTWDKSDKVKFLTVGYAISQEGTNGGFGAAFGLLHACGVDKKLLKFVHDNIGPVLAINQFAGRLDGTMPLAKAYDKVVERDIPWWKEYEETGQVPV